MLPPPARASFVVKFPDGQPLSCQRCDQIAEAPHSAPLSGCTMPTKSTQPSSSPELGTPSGPSLSYWPKLTAASCAVSTSVTSSPVRAGVVLLGSSPFELPS